MDLTAATLWWLAAGVAVAAELATGTFYLLMLALGLAAGALAAHLGLARRRRSSTAALVGGGATALVALAPRASAAPAPARAATATSISTSASACTSPPGPPTARPASSYRGAAWAVRSSRARQPVPGEHVIAAVEGNWLVLAARIVRPLLNSECPKELMEIVTRHRSSSPRSSSSRRSRSCRSSTPGSSRSSASTTARSTPGLNFVMPFIERVAYKHSLKEVPLDVPSQVCITTDNTQLQVDGIIYFQVTDPMRASYGSSNYIVAITQLAQTLLRSVIGKMELDKTFEERDHINLVGRRRARRGGAPTGA